MIRTARPGAPPVAAAAPIAAHASARIAAHAAAPIAARATARAAALLFAAALAPPLSAQTFSVRKFDIGGAGFFDYVTVDTARDRVFVSRGSHIMVVDGATGRVVGDIADTPRTHGALIVNATNHGFTTNAGDSTSTMFDLKTLAVIRTIHTGAAGLDGFTYDGATNRALTIDHSRPAGSAVVIDAASGEVVTRLTTSGVAPEGGVSDGKGRIYINVEDRNAIDVVDTKTWKVVDTWSIEPCDGPTGIAMDHANGLLFVGCGGASVVVDAGSGKVVAKIPNGEGVDGIAWDPEQKLIYIPAGREGNVTVARQDAPDRYTVVATVATMAGARTIGLNTKTHTAYVFTPEFGPAAAPPAPSPAPPGRRPRGPQVAAWLFAITH